MAVESIGLTPMSPVIAEGGTVEIPDFVRIAKLPAVPRFIGACAAVATDCRNIMATPTRPVRTRLLPFAITADELVFILCLCFLGRIKNWLNQEGTPYLSIWPPAIGCNPTSPCNAPTPTGAIPASAFSATKSTSSALTPSRFSASHGMPNGTPPTSSLRLMPTAALRLCPTPWSAAHRKR